MTTEEQTIESKRTEYVVAEPQPEMRPDHLVTTSEKPIRDPLTPVEIEDNPDNPAQFRIQYGADQKGQPEHVVFNCRDGAFDGIPQPQAEDIKKRMKAQLESLLDTGQLEVSDEPRHLNRVDERDMQLMYETKPDEVASMMVLDQLARGSEMQTRLSRNFTTAQRGQILGTIQFVEDQMRDVIKSEQDNALEKDYPDVHKKLHGTVMERVQANILGDRIKWTNEERSVLMEVKRRAREKVLGRPATQFITSYESHKTQHSHLFAEAQKEKDDKVRARKLNEARRVVLDSMTDMFPEPPLLDSEYYVAHFTDRHGRAIVVNRRTELDAEGKFATRVRQAGSLSIYEGEDGAQSSELDIQMARVFEDAQFYEEMGVLDNGNLAWRNQLVKDVRDEYFLHKDRKTAARIMDRLGIKISAAEEGDTKTGVLGRRLTVTEEEGAQGQNEQDAAIEDEQAANVVSAIETMNEPQVEDNTRIVIGEKVYRRVPLSEGEQSDEPKYIDQDEEQVLTRSELIELRNRNRIGIVDLIPDENRIVWSISSADQTKLKEDDSEPQARVLTFDCGTDVPGIREHQYEFRGRMAGIVANLSELAQDGTLAFEVKEKRVDYTTRARAGDRQQSVKEVDYGYTKDERLNNAAVREIFTAMHEADGGVTLKVMDGANVENETVKVTSLVTPDGKAIVLFGDPPRKGQIKAVDLNIAQKWANSGEPLQVNDIDLYMIESDSSKVSLTDRVNGYNSLNG